MPSDLGAETRPGFRLSGGAYRGNERGGLRTQQVGDGPPHDGVRMKLLKFGPLPGGAFHGRAVGERVAGDPAALEPHLYIIAVLQLDRAAAPWD